MNHIVKHAVITSLCILGSLSMLQPIDWLFPGNGEIVGPKASIAPELRNDLEALLLEQDYKSMIKLLESISIDEAIEWNEEIAHAGHAVGWYNLLKHLSASGFSHGKPEAISQGLSYVIIIEILTKMALCCRIADVAPEDCIDTWQDILSLKARQYFFDKINKKLLKAKTYKRAIEIATTYFKEGLKGDFVATIPHSVWVNKVIWASKKSFVAWSYASPAIVWQKPENEDTALFLEFIMSHASNEAASKVTYDQIQAAREEVYVVTIDAYKAIFDELKEKEAPKNNKGKEKRK